ncbi:MAG: hypothetical protein RL660_3025 [Bacteroidota bacterium]|jgi:hypothetical protein
MVRKLLSIIAILISSAAYAQTEAADGAAAKYIAKYKDLAIEEQVRTGVPAAITLAQGVYETGSGSSPLAIEARNHFGIKCKKDWTGETMLHDDDAMQECFRKYPTDRDSYIDHSNFLKNNRRYAFLFDIPVENYKDWAVGLRRAGYATNPAYSSKLIALIEKHNLQQYTAEATKLASNKIAAKIAEDKAKEAQLAAEANAASAAKKARQDSIKAARVAAIDAQAPEKIKLVEESYMGLSGFYAKKGERLLQASIDRGIRYQKLLELNDLEDEELPCDMFIFTERKYKKHPTRRSHLIAEGEDMLIVAQKEAMQLRALLALNLLKINDTPLVGQRVYLQDVVSRPPKLRGFDAPVKNAAPEVVKENVSDVAVEPAPVVAAAPVEAAPQEDTDVKLANRLFGGNSAQDPTQETNTPSQETTITASDAERIRAAKAELAREEFGTQVADVSTQSTTASTEAEAQRQADEQAASKRREEIEQARLLAQQQEQARLQAEESARKLAEANAQEVAAAPIVVAAPVQPVQPPAPRPKSPSTYNESGVSSELHRMKRVMDEVVYAAPPPPKPKLVDTVARPAAPKPSTSPKPSTTATNTAPKPAIAAKPNTGTTTKPAATAVTAKPNTTVAKPATSATKPATTTPKPGTKPAATQPANSKPAAKPSGAKTTAATKPTDTKASPSKTTTDAKAKQQVPAKNTQAAKTTTKPSTGAANAPKVVNRQAATSAATDKPAAKTKTTQTKPAAKK